MDSTNIRDILTQGKLLAGLSKIWAGAGDGVKELVRVGDKVNYSGYADSAGYANSAGNIPDVTPYYNHINNYSNPHGVNCAQIGAAAANHSHDDVIHGVEAFTDTDSQHPGQINNMALPHSPKLVIAHSTMKTKSAIYDKDDNKIGEDYYQFPVTIVLTKTYVIKIADGSTSYGDTILGGTYNISGNNITILPNSPAFVKQGYLVVYFW